MKVAILGAGGVGAYYGGLLARAGNAVVLLARGPNLDALRDRGLEVRTPDGRSSPPSRRSARQERSGAPTSRSLP